MADDEVRTGSCLCGAVTYQVTGPMRPVWACHCNQCRKQTGNFVTATSAPRDKVEVTGAESIEWYAASEIARRGFCRVCGSLIFWDPVGDQEISICAGSLDGETGLMLDAHIFCADKGDYYEIADGVPQYAQSRRSPDA